MTQTLLSVKDFPSSLEILPQAFLNKYKTIDPQFGFNGLGYVVFKRTYARAIDPVSRKLLSPVEIDEFQKAKKAIGTEEWYETIERCVRGAQAIGARLTREEAEQLYDAAFHMKLMFSGRSMWQLGTNIQYMDSLLNCWVTKISEIDDFVFMLTQSMLGGGVGCNISKEYTFELPRVKTHVNISHKNTKDADFIVPDSKEGWIELLRLIANSFLITGKSFTFSTICIRPEGELLKTFGGIAPGPKPLIDGALSLIKLFEGRAGKKLRTDDVADWITVQGEIIKSGGVRRTALILGGDPDDVSYLNLKRWDLFSIPNHRSNSNNSIFAKSFDQLTPKFWDGYEGNGEPYGLLNLPLARKFGRLGESCWGDFDLSEPHITMYNPCAEACLLDKECCNLFEAPINRISSKEEMIRLAILGYKVQKAIASGPYLFKATEKVVHRNMKLGMSVTGICQRLDVYKDWCDATYKALREFDLKWSKFNGWPPSIRLTVIQPSGTKSLLSGSTPGGHPGYARHHIRRVRFNHNETIVDFLRKMNVPLEYEVGFDGKVNHKIIIGSFPAEFSESTLIKDDNFSAIDQLNLVKDLQTVWADQAVSVTVYYKKEELPQIKEWLKTHYESSIKSISFLLHSDHGFKQAPYEKISKEEYDKMVKSIKPVAEVLKTYSMVGNTSESVAESIECSTGACPVR